MTLDRDAPLADLDELDEARKERYASDFTDASKTAGAIPQL